MRHLNMIQLLIILLIVSPIHFIYDLIMGGVSDIDDALFNLSYYWKDLFPTALFFYVNNIELGLSFNEWLDKNPGKKHLSRNTVNSMIMFFTNGDKLIFPRGKSEKVDYFK